MLRDYQEEDILKIVNLEKTTLHSTLEENYYLANINNPLFKCYVLEDNNIFIGFISAMFDGKIMEIYNFCIEPDYQSKGYGSKLLDEFFSLFGDSLKSIILEVRNSNAKGIGIYQKYGFKTIRIRKSYYSNGDDALFMQKVFK